MTLSKLSVYHISYSNVQSLIVSEDYSRLFLQGMEEKSTTLWTEALFVNLNLKLAWILQQMNSVVLKKRQWMLDDDLEGLWKELRYEI